MLGDITGAFRHGPIHAEHVHVFGLLIDDLPVLNLSCGFGWCGSPTFYSLAGTHINGQYELGHGLTRTLVGNVWCDDHINVEADINTRCFDANLALRRAMATVLGPSAINELKFTKWATTGKALGLLWDTDRECVSIPAEKIEKQSSISAPCQESYEDESAASAGQSASRFMLLPPCSLIFPAPSDSN